MTGVDSRHRPRRDRKPAVASEVKSAHELGAPVASNSCLGTSPHQQERDTKMAMLSFGGLTCCGRCIRQIAKGRACSAKVSRLSGAARTLDLMRGSDGPQSRDRFRLGVRDDPGSAAHRYTMLQGARV